MHRSGICDVACSGYRGEDKVVKTVQVFTQMVWYVLSHLWFLFILHLSSWFLVVFLGGVDNSCWEQVLELVEESGRCCPNGISCLLSNGDCCLRSSDPLQDSMIWLVHWPSNEILSRACPVKISNFISVSLALSAVRFCRLRRPIVKKNGVSLSRSLKCICSAFCKGSILGQSSLTW